MRFKQFELGPGKVELGAYELLAFGCLNVFGYGNVYFLFNV